MTTSKLARLFAELVGTFVLTAVVLSIGKTYGTPLFTAIAGGTTFAVLVAVLGPVSGGHFNPATTLGLFSIRRISLLKAVLYVAMQSIGAVLAWKAFEWFSPERLVALAATEFDWKVFTAELIGGVIFSLGVAAVVLRRYTGNQAGAIVGMAFFAASAAVSIVIINRQIATGIINPAVAIGIGYRPENQSYLAYFFGPVIGAVIGMNLYKMFFNDPTNEVKASASKSVSSVASSSTVSSAKSKTVAKKPATRKKVAAKKTTTRKTTRRS